MIDAWTIYFSNRKNTIAFVINMALLALVLYFFLHFLSYNENRRGYVFHDPVLNLFSPADFSVFTFGLTYFMVFLGITIALKTPVLFVRLMKVYTLIVLLRMLSMYILPLEAPPHIIPLKDFFLKNTFYSGRENYKDLFFSGHTATVFMFGIYFNNRKVKIIFFTAAALVGLLLILQHVHYSIDVFAAPFFVGIAAYIQRKTNFNLE